MAEFEKPGVGDSEINGGITDRPIKVGIYMNCLLPKIPSIVDANGKGLKYIIKY
jgi:hypothetical protein